MHNTSPTPTSPTPPDLRYKLSKEQQEQIAERVESANETQSQIAADFGIGRRRVGQIAKRAILRQKKEKALRQTVSQSTCPTITEQDAVTWLEKQPLCDLLLTDPPYSTDIEDIATFAKSWLPLALSKVKPTGRAYVFIGAYPSELQAYLNVSIPTQVLVWLYRNTLGPRPNHRYKQDWQAILYYRGDDSSPLKGNRLVELTTVQEMAAPRESNVTHYGQWEKPMDLGERFVLQSTEPGDLVLDPFAGTGTFLLAAAKTGRKAQGCDIDPKMVSIAKKRGCRNVL